MACVLLMRLPNGRCWSRTPTGYSMRGTIPVSFSVGTVELVHLKDGADGKGTSIGDGKNNLQSIVDTSRDIGIEWVIAEIENESPDAESVRDAKNSFTYMTEKLGL